MQTQIVDGITKDTLLYEKDVAFGLFDLLRHIQQICPLLFEDLVHLAVVVDDNLVLHIGFGRAKLKLDEANLGLFYSRGPVGTLDNRLVEDESVNHLAVLDRAADLFDYSDISQIYIFCALLINRLEHGVHSNGSEKIGMLRHNF